MKKFILSFSFLALIFTTAKAQFDMENLFGGGNVAYAKPIGDFSEFAKGGFSYNLLAGYKLTEKLGVGLEYGTAATVALDDSLSSGFLGVNIYGLQSVMAKGWYRFMTDNFRPYVGLGIGAAQVAEPDLSDGVTTIKGAKRWGLGVNAEIGINIKGFNLSYSFNMNGKSPKESVFNDAGAIDLSVNYHRIAAGYIYNF